MVEFQQCSYRITTTSYQSILELTTQSEIASMLCQVLTNISTSCPALLKECFATEDVEQMKQLHMQEMKEFLLRVAKNRITAKQLEDCIEDILEHKQELDVVEARGNSSQHSDTQLINSSDSRHVTNVSVHHEEDTHSVGMSSSRQHSESQPSSNSSAVKVNAPTQNVIADQDADSHHEDNFDTNHEAVTMSPEEYHEEYADPPIGSAANHTRDLSEYDLFQDDFEVEGGSDQGQQDASHEYELSQSSNINGQGSNFDHDHLTEKNLMSDNLPEMIDHGDDLTYRYSNHHSDDINDNGQQAGSGHGHEDNQVEDHMKDRSDHEQVVEVEHGTHEAHDGHHDVLPDGDHDQAFVDEHGSHEAHDSHHDILLGSQQADEPENNDSFSQVVRSVQDYHVIDDAIDDFKNNVVDAKSSVSASGTSAFQGEGGRQLPSSRRASLVIFSSSSSSVISEPISFIVTSLLISQIHFV
jgi:hypothetical protein